MSMREHVVTYSSEACGSMLQRIAKSMGEHVSILSVTCPGLLEDDWLLSRIQVYFITQCLTKIMCLEQLNGYKVQLKPLVCETLNLLGDCFKLSRTSTQAAELYESSEQ